MNKLLSSYLLLLSLYGLGLFNGNLIATPLLLVSFLYTACVSIGIIVIFELFRRKSE